MIYRTSGGLGDCYEAAGKLMSQQDSGTSMVLVHGEVRASSGPIEGTHFGHAWIEAGDIVLDYSNGQRVRMARPQYYALGNIWHINNMHRYTWEEFQDKIATTKHWGPWDLKTSSGL